MVEKQEKPSIQYNRIKRKARTIPFGYKIDDTGNYLIPIESELKALEEAKSDFDLAIDWLRKNGISTAQKKGSRLAFDGLIAIDHNESEASIIEINSETDFVARNHDFQDFVGEVSKLNLALKGNIDNLNATKYKSTTDTVSSFLVHLISKIGEKINIRRSDYIKENNGFVGTYIHNVEKDNMGKIGVIVSINTNLSKDKIDDVLKKISMHIAAASPISLNINDLDKNLIKKEKDIILEQINDNTKDQPILDKIIDGKIRKFYNEIVLLEQKFIIDDKIKVIDYIEHTAKELGGEINIKNFVRYKVGEGLK